MNQYQEAIKRVGAAFTEIVNSMDLPHAAAPIWEGWAMIELYGRGNIVGQVELVAVGACWFLQVTVPENPPDEGYVKYFSIGLVEAFTPLAEDLARVLLMTIRPDQV